MPPNPQKIKIRQGCLTDHIGKAEKEQGTGPHRATNTDTSYQFANLTKALIRPWFLRRLTWPYAPLAYAPASSICQDVL